MKFGRDLNIRTENEESWLTPPYILKSLGDFDLDPCFLPKDVRPWDTAKKHYWKEVDGLSKIWYGRVWLNPPYGQKTFKWIEKLSCHGNGIALAFARTETRGFHNFVWDRADAVFFFKGRIKFFDIHSKEAKYVAPAPNCLIAYGQNNVKALQESNLRGKIVLLDNSEKCDKINLFFE